ncbi:MAG: PspC domain-containing protein [Propionibacteriaceae bacterium]|jgi:phage shock protein PspC (stress-responsive transcriptional regulator)|nr:PspC domain-containing protein [Propionibacteriaceae bacterium]
MALKKLRRSHKNRFIAGVCGGIGEFLNVDANIVRLVFIAASLITVGTTVLVYFALWVVLADDTTGELGADKLADVYEKYRNRPTTG